MPDRVELRAVRKEYAGQVAVETVDLTIAAGEFLVLLGPSGSGKTTILNMIGGFAEPSSGQVLIDGEDVTGLPPARRPTATVFQDYALFPHMSVLANVGFGLRMRQVPAAVRDRRAAEMLKLVGLEGFGSRGIHQMSGGQRQRVALARAMAVEPKVLLLDEPLGALDLALRRQMQEELVRLQKQLGATFVHVTHDQEEAMSIADRIVVMSHGRIEDMGPPSRVYLRPASLFTARFMGESNLIPATVTAARHGQLTATTAFGDWRLAGAAEAGGAVHIALRPEQLLLGPPEGEALDLGWASVTDVSFQGTHQRCHCRTPAADLILRAPASATLTAESRLHLYAKASDAVVLTH